MQILVNGDTWKLKITYFVDNEEFVNRFPLVIDLREKIFYFSYQISYEHLICF